MSIHYENNAAAEAHLTSKGYRKLASGNWVSDAGFAAHILSAHGDMVLVQFWEIR